MESDGEISYYIKDNGIGFDMEEAGSLFNVFHRLQSDFEGAGIGLATVKNVITKQGGRAWAEAKRGEGAVFHFSLPRRDLTAGDIQFEEELKSTGT